jgi:hypothetical protein
MTTKLSLFNEALGLLGERPLASTSENREPGRRLNAIWDDGAVKALLESGQWTFATRTISITYSPSIDPSFDGQGYKYAFDKPSDFVRTTELCSDGRFQNEITDYQQDAHYWFCDFDTIYLRYVSIDDAYGNDLSTWPENFKKYAQAWLAVKLAPTSTKDDQNKALMLEKQLERRKVEALATDAMENPTQFPKETSWQKARGGRARFYNENGSPR